MTTTSAVDNVSIARRFPEDVATEGNLDLLDELLADDYVEHGSFDTIRGREATREDVENFREAFSDFSATVESAFGGDDMVAMRLTLRGTHSGPFMGIEPTGKSFEVANFVFTRVEDGKIAERWLQPDTLGLMTQLGVVEPPTSAQ